MESLIEYTNRIARENYIWSRTGPEIAPAEPTTKPTPVITPQPSKDDPFNVPAPKINPTPKGLL